MALIDFFFRRKPQTAAVARERLQIILAHERATRHAPEFLPALQQEILKVVEKYFPIDPETVKLHVERHATFAKLELNIALPAESAPAAS
ncbi:cell division topological specificity factor MinE [Candidatus Binatia bacterium]|nr:cell division topological specificity factor MinE [Candidatus Binatia bacterium]